MIRGITFSEQTFYSKDFAHYQNFFLNGANGITKGCQITNDTTTVSISEGYFFVQGRLMAVESTETVRANQGFQNGYNRIVYEIDLSKTNTVAEFRQGYIKVLNNTNLVQQDLENGGTIYQLPLCHFQWSGTAITSLVSDAPILKISNILAQISKDYDVYKIDFEKWFGVQKSTVLKMIDDLKAQGFAKTFTKTITLSTNWLASGTEFKQTVNVTGILATDNPIVDLVTGVDFKNEQKAWSKVYKIVTANGSVTAYSTEQLAVPLNIQVKVVR